MNSLRMVIAGFSDAAKKKIKNTFSQKGYTVYECNDGATALRLVRNIRPDIVIIDSDLKGMNGYDVARIIEGDGIAPVLFIASAFQEDLIDIIKDRTMFTYIVKPISMHNLVSTVEYMTANYRRLSKMQEEINKLKNSLEARKKIERAKGLLMKYFNISEEEAYRKLRKESMDRCLSMEVIAEEILNKYGN